MKKVIRLIAIGIIALFCFMISAHAEEIYFELNGFAFDINSDGKAVIHEYYGNKTDVAIPDKFLRAQVVGIGDNAFCDADITSLCFANTQHLAFIGSSAFSGCSALTEVALPETVTQIGSGAFGGCDNLQYAYLSDRITSIGQNAFGGDSNLVIRTVKDSYAAQYAQENNIPVEYSYEYMLGDADDNGIISVFDATAIQRVLAHAENDPDGMITLRGCVTGDTLNMIDVTTIQRHLAKLDTAYSVGDRISTYIPA